MTGAEIGQHMCDVAAEAVVMNGYAAKCLMINKDVRRIDAAAKVDGTPPDMEQKANLCVFEVRHMPAPACTIKGGSHNNSVHGLQHLTMHHVATAAVFMQVFDSGLIGEGVLHLMAWAQARLLTPDYTLVSPSHLGPPDAGNDHHDNCICRPFQGIKGISNVESGNNIEL